METTENKKPRICAIPRRNSGFLPLGAILLILAGIVMLLLRLVFRENPYAEVLYPVFPALAGIVAGWLLIMYRKRDGLFLPAALALACAMTIYFRYNAGSWGFFAALLIILSAVGWSFNISYSFLPPRLRLPVLNLVSLALALLCLLKSVGSIQSAMARQLEATIGAAWLIALIMLLPLLSMILLNLSVEAHIKEKSTQPRVLSKSVPRNGSRGFIIAVCILLAAGGANMLITMLNFLNIRELLYTLPEVLIAILLLTAKGREKNYSAAMILLAVDALLGYLFAPYLRSWQIWTYYLPVLLMLLSALGVTGNSPLPSLPAKLQVPLLNLIAAPLLLLNSLLIAQPFLRALFRSLTDPQNQEAVKPSWQLIISILLPLSLALLNLSLDSRPAERKKGNLPANIPYRNGLRGLMQWLYNDVGGKLQTLARIQGIICLVLAGLSSVAVASGLLGVIISYIGSGYPGSFLMIMLAGGAGILASLLLIITTWPLFAFGQITSDVHTLKEGGGLAAGGLMAPENPDDLPEL